VGEGGDGEKVEGLGDHLKNEEKGESSEGKSTSHMRTYESTLPFLHLFFTRLSSMQRKTLSLPCIVALFTHDMRFLILAQESFDHKVHLNVINVAGESRCVPINCCFRIVKLHNSLKVSLQTCELVHWAWRGL